MNKNFADIAEAIAKIQFDCDEAIEKLDSYAKRTKELENLSDQDKQEILDIIATKRKMALVRTANMLYSKRIS